METATASPKMMRGGVSVLLLLLAPCVTLAALQFERAEADPRNPNACLLGRDDSLPIGDSYTTVGCKKLTCYRQDGSLFLESATCGAVGAEPPCAVEAGKPWWRHDYPDCCPRVACPWDDVAYPDY